MSPWFSIGCYSIIVVNTSGGCSLCRVNEGEKKDNS